MNVKEEINEYLFYEFGFEEDNDESLVSEVFPYSLTYLGDLNFKNRNIKVYEFLDDDESNFVLYGGGISTFKKGGMSLQDLHYQLCGQSWIGEKSPIDLNTSKIGYENIPPINIRRGIIEELSTGIYVLKDSLIILEGLFLIDEQKYLALIEDANNKHKFIVGTDISPELIELNNLSPWRILSWGIGKMIEEGRLK